MDPLTHTATGLFLSRAGLNRLTPMAAPIVMLAANAPDIDIVTLAGGPLNYLHYHRHLTHALAAMPLMALLPVVLVWAVGRRPIRWGGAFPAALVAVASHLLLDYTNVYGIRLLLPFSPAWLRLDWTPVVDLWIWSALLLGIAGPFLSRLVTSEITSGQRKPKYHGRGFAWFALMFLLLYNCGRAVLHERAVAVLDARLYDGGVPARVAAIPTASPLTWRGLVETRDSYRVREVDLTRFFDPGRGPTFQKALEDPAINAARQTSTFQVFQMFAQFPLWRVTPAFDPPGGRNVELFDMRFGTPLEPGFVMASALVNGQNQVLSTYFQFGTARTARIR
ncbi:MAG TPA: metal-dependent hydrolase [Bryobacteraceae bacterium]|nr:metal-dependent hydrolase [Bryobacteraceae bacterium]